MLKIKPQYITDDKGNKISVVLSLEDYQALIDELEEMEDLDLYDESKNDSEPSTPIDEAFRIVEAERNAK